MSPLEGMITLVHSHGIGRFDFSSLESCDLEPLDDIARERGLLLCPTVYLRRDYLHRFTRLIHTFSSLKRSGSLPHILGFSMEGPLLGREGGIPRGGIWNPSISEWHEIVDLGRYGLRYIVLAPDTMALDDHIGASYRFEDLLRECYDAGLRIAFGHFRRDDPTQSAACIYNVLTYLHQHYQPSPYLVLTDHLFNDMPRAFIHAWRTKRELSSRDTELSRFMAKPWLPQSLAETLGPVPAALLNAARERKLTPTLNFDGFHVDLEICRLAVNYLGADRLIPITDDTELNMIAGEALHRIEGSPLRYRDDQKVAAGSSGYEKQISNMKSIGITETEIEFMFGALATEALKYSPQTRGQTTDANI
jgi:N-acetylglucosamine-6-phosphate deacetylase